MIDTFYCIPFDLLHLIFKVKLTIKSYFSVKEFLLKFNEIDAAVPFFTITSNLHKVTSFFDVTAVKTNVT